jgi:hypothetical protein
VPVASLDVSTAPWAIRVTTSRSSPLDGTDFGENFCVNADWPCVCVPGVSLRAAELRLRDGMDRQVLAPLAASADDSLTMIMWMDVERTEVLRLTDTAALGGHEPALGGETRHRTEGESIAPAKLSGRPGWESRSSNRMR